MKSTGVFSRPYCVSLKSFEIMTNFMNKNAIFCEFSNFSKVLQVQSAWEIFNIIFWNNHSKGLFGWYKPKFNFSELIWDSRRIKNEEYTPFECLFWESPAIGLLVGEVNTRTEGRARPCPMESIRQHLKPSANTWGTFRSLSQSEFRLVEPKQRETGRVRPCLIQSIHQHFTPSINSSVCF